MEKLNLLIHGNLIIDGDLGIYPPSNFIFKVNPSDYDLSNCIEMHGDVRIKANNDMYGNMIVKGEVGITGDYEILYSGK